MPQRGEDALPAAGVSRVGVDEAAYTQAGGIYVYLREAYGGLIAFIFGYWIFMGLTVGGVIILRKKKAGHCEAI